VTISGTLPGGLIPVIVGYGRAGRDLHHMASRQIAGSDVAVIAVDPARPPRLPPDARWAPTLEEGLDVLGDPASAVFHVTTPVGEHRRVVEAIVAAGATRVVLEKPLAATSADARRIAALATAGVRVLPVGPWLASAVTEKVEKCIANGDLGMLLTLHMEQSKPRFRRAQTTRAHRSALEVELPHQLLLALTLGGPVEALTHAATWPLPLPGGATLPRMGGASATLVHRSGLTSTLVSDLTAPVRMRRLRISGSAGKLVAHYPLGAGADHIGQLQLPGRHELAVVDDAPLTQFLAAAYLHFAGLSDPPRGDLALHLRMVELLEAAAARALPEPGGVLAAC
jgi:predicted dehydrogenase